MSRSETTANTVAVGRPRRLIPAAIIPQAYPGRLPPVRAGRPACSRPARSRPCRSRCSRQGVPRKPSAPVPGPGTGALRTPPGAGERSRSVLLAGPGLRRGGAGTAADSRVLAPLDGVPVAVAVAVRLGNHGLGERAVGDPASPAPDAPRTRRGHPVLVRLARGRQGGGHLLRVDHTALLVRQRPGLLDELARWQLPDDPDLHAVSEQFRIPAL